MVDLGTGGGELLSHLTPLPPFSCATEGYLPNVPVAKKKLAPLGVEVIRTYCDDNYAIPQRGALPFRDSSIDLVIDRHESFKADEVLRVLRRGGVFITQQVGSRTKSELNEFLGAKIPEVKWTLATAKAQLENAGFSIIEEAEAEPRAIFKDIGAVVCYLRIAEWQIDDFEVAAYEEKLRQLDSHIRKNGIFEAHNHLFFLRGVKR
ncbi:MAG: SAM-dependent methyltransferase [Thermoplasmata archaeon YP2-bin.285]|uniref:SAM-dependent methyltransferase n=1 Tax=Candidatus Sysuiplasma superficiale TaxID=2823368 RepID=A0A8J7YLM6_9ARCH|nr:SAM-dependent methyltransferase [Candidatus Sysuiplasma superficiale]